MGYYSGFKFPNICARCGSDHVVDRWELESKKTVYDLSTLLYALIGYLSYKRKTYTFKVPVCYSCKKSLKNIILTNKIITFLLILAGFIVATISGGIIAGLVGGLIGYILSRITAPIIRFFANAKFGSYNGTYFKFSNRKFMNEFAAKNPTYVKD